MGDSREVLTWETYGRAVRALAQTVWDSGFRPEVLVCVARGGLIPGGSVAYALDVKSLLMVNVEFYTGVGETLSRPRLVDAIPNEPSLNGRRVLIVDDVADSGETLEFVTQLCLERTDQVRVAVLYQKPRSCIDADFVWKRTDRWIAFPWSAEPTIPETTAD